MSVLTPKQAQAEAWRLAELERKAERRLMLTALAEIAFLPILIALLLVWVVIL